MKARTADQNTADRVRELEAERDSYKRTANDLAIRVANSEALLDECERTLKDVRPLVEAWCFTQGNSECWIEETLGPIDNALYKLRGEQQ